jgi:hypothetical protein
MCAVSAESLPQNPQKSSISTAKMNKKPIAVMARVGAIFISPGERSSRRREKNEELSTRT